MASRFPSLSSLLRSKFLSMNSDDYSTCVIHTKTIIHLSACESGGYLFVFIFGIRSPVNSSIPMEIDKCMKTQCPKRHLDAWPPLLLKTLSI